MKNKLDINMYLQKYSTSSLKSQGIEASTVTYSASSPFRDVHNIQNSNYSRSQLECIEQLTQLKLSLNGQSKDLELFVCNLSNNVCDGLLQYSSQIRQELHQSIDRVIDEHQKLIVNQVKAEIDNLSCLFQPNKTSILGLIEEMSFLDNKIRGEKYKQAIAEIVTSDFQRQIRKIQGQIQDSKNRIMSNLPVLAVQPKSLAIIKQSLHKLTYVKTTADMGSSIKIQQPRKTPKTPKNSFLDFARCGW